MVVKSWQPRMFARNTLRYLKRKAKASGFRLELCSGFYRKLNSKQRNQREELVAKYCGSEEVPCLPENTENVPMKASDIAI